MTRKDVLAHYNLKTICLSTVWRWMMALGLKHSEEKNCYYVDGHEREDVAKSRWTFVQEYLGDKLYMFQWIQIPLSNALEYESN